LPCRYVLECCVRPEYRAGLWQETFQTIRSRQTEFVQYVSAWLPVVRCPFAANFPLVSSTAFCLTSASACFGARFRSKNFYVQTRNCRSADRREIHLVQRRHTHTQGRGGKLSFLHH